MEEVKETTSVSGVPQEQAIPVATIQPQSPDLQKEIDRKEAEIKRLQGLVKDAQKRGVPKEEIDALNKRFDGIEELTATMADRLEEQFGESDVKTTKKTHRQELDEKRQVKPKVEPVADPDVQKFIGYLNSQDLAYDDPLVQEAIAEDRTPQDALKYIKGKVEAKSQVIIDKKAEEIAKNLVEQKLKDLGLTASGAGGPSAPGTAWRDASPEEKILRGVSGKK